MFNVIHSCFSSFSFGERKCNLDLPAFPLTIHSCSNPFFKPLSLTPFLCLPHYPFLLPCHFFFLLFLSTPSQPDPPSPSPPSVSYAPSFSFHLFVFLFS